MLSGQRLRWSAWFFVLMAGVLVAVVTVTVFFVLRFPSAVRRPLERAVPAEAVAGERYPPQAMDTLDSERRRSS